MYWKVSSPSRLHFGLIDLTGDHGRIDGGSGAALAHPRVVVRVGRGQGRIEAPPALERLVRALADKLAIDINDYDVEIPEYFPAHVGLGSHTQQALAIGTALTKAAGRELSPKDIAKAAKRGGTSGIGVNIFSRGGLVIDGGHAFGPGQEKEECLPSSASRAGVPPLLARYDLPEEWRFALVTPETVPGAHGKKEIELFGEAFPLEPSDAGEVCRWVLTGLMPGAAAGDLDLLGRSLSALQTVGFKRREVELQPEPIIELGKVMVDAGAAGAGLTSFGPTVYALAGSATLAQRALDAAIAHLGKHDIDAEGWITAPDNQGVIITREND